MLIAFIHRKKAFLPSISAVSEFFNSYGIETVSIDASRLSGYKPDVQWHLMGIDKTQTTNEIVKIHQYNSASVPPFRGLKDFGKTLINSRPHFRLFLNEYVKSRFSFRDHIPSGFLDCGIRSIDEPSTRKEFDFIYVGEVAAHRKLDHLWDLFSTGSMNRHSLLVLSAGYEDLQNKLGKFTNIHFAGPVPSAEVGTYIQRARYGINLIPDEEPFNSQTSAKLLDYAAAGIPIISNDYRWIRQFEKKYSGRYFYVGPQLENLNWENLQNFQFGRPDLQELYWEDIIRRSGVLEFLESRFPELNFDEMTLA